MMKVRVKMGDNEASVELDKDMVTPAIKILINALASSLLDLNDKKAE